MSMETGASMSAIAQRFYGNGEQQARPFEANGGQAEPDGTALTRYGVIYPGWVLRLPEATQANAKRARSRARGRSRRNDDGM